MTNYKFTDREKKKSILNYFSNNNSISLKQLTFQSNFFSKNLICSENKLGVCGDYFYSLLIINSDLTVNFFYCSNDCCILSSALASLFYHYINNADLKLVKNLIFNFDKMINNKKYNRINFEKLVVFEDVLNFPNRIGCLKIIRDAIFEFIKFD